MARPKKKGTKPTAVKRKGAVKKGKIAHGPSAEGEDSDDQVKEPYRMVTQQELLERHLARVRSRRSAKRKLDRRDANVPDVGLPLSSVTVYNTVSIVDMDPGRELEDAPMIDFIRDDKFLSLDWNENNKRLNQFLSDDPSGLDHLGIPDSLLLRFSTAHASYYDYLENDGLAHKTVGLLNGTTRKERAARKKAGWVDVKIEELLEPGLLTSLERQFGAHAPTGMSRNEVFYREYDRIRYFIDDWEKKFGLVAANGLWNARRAIMRYLPVGAPFMGPFDLANEPEEDKALLPMRPALGVRIRHEQGWRMKGVTMGKLLHSLCLAPGEVTQLATMSWERGTKGSTTESIAEKEATKRQAARDRASNQVKNAVANELQTGGSSVSTHSEDESLAAGGSILGFGGSGSAGHNSSEGQSVNYSTGERNAAADSVSKVREHTAQHASDQRSRTAALVQEVSVNESERFETRVVANYNHMHALNMMYFEVLQVYELATRPVHAERCLFLPMKCITFDGQAVQRFGPELIKAAERRRRPILARAIYHHSVGLSRSNKELKRLEKIKNAIQSELDDLDKKTIPKYDKHINQAESDVISAKNTVRKTTAFRDENEKALRAEIDTYQKAVSAETKKMQETVEKWTRELHSVKEEIVDFFLGDEHRSVIEMKIKDAKNGCEKAVSAKKAAYETACATIQTAIKQAADDVTQGEADLTAKRAKLKNLRNDKAKVIAKRDRVNSRLQVATAKHSDLEEAQKKKLEFVLDELNADRLSYNQRIWMQMTPAKVQAMLSGRSFMGTNLVETIDPHPVAVEGEYLGFIWSFREDQKEEEETFWDRYVSETFEVKDSCVFPTGGVFAESVLGRSNAAEKLDLTRFWKWNDDTIPILPTAIQKLKHAQHAQRGEAKPGQMAASNLKLQQLPDAPPGPAGELMNVIAASMFRDMSGGETMKGLIEHAQKAAATGDEESQIAAQKNLSAYMDHLEEALPKLAQAMKNQKSDPSTEGAMKNSLGEAGNGGVEVEAGEEGTMGLEAIEGLAADIGPEALLLL